VRSDIACRGDDCRVRRDGAAVRRVVPVQAGLNAYWDFRILVHVDAATSVAQALVRDVGVLGSRTTSSA
jgi:hypothetical protein